MNTSEVLNKAADLIEERGWTTGPRGWRDDSGLCLEGAIAAAMGRQVGHEDGELSADLINACPAGQAVRAYLGNRLAVRGLDMDVENTWLCHWNDDRGAALIEAAREQQTTPAAEREG